MVNDLALALQRRNHHLGAVGGNTLFIASDQERERALHIACRNGAGRGGGKGGDGALHIGGASSNDHAVDNRRAKGRLAPGSGVTHRHHIGVAGEAQVGRGGAKAGIEVLDLSELHSPTDEA